MSLTAAIFNSSGAVRIIVQTSEALRLNSRLRSGETWRVVPTECATGADVPSLESLDPHPDLVEPA